MHRITEVSSVEEMETFIVRIYRGISTSAREPAGTVERVGSGDRVGFSGRGQLLDCLLVPERGGSGDRCREADDAHEQRDGT